MRVSLENVNLHAGRQEGEGFCSKLAELEGPLTLLAKKKKREVQRSERLTGPPFSSASIAPSPDLLPRWSASFGHPQGERKSREAPLFFSPSPFALVEDLISSDFFFLLRPSYSCRPA